ncbi:FAD-dependent monooxygenase [Methylobacterium durans]|uniref:FAD-dependent monooxygenase n=1 Tax=Methylobacterium durans TaxID=2202825 RepID=UPI002AFF79C5|nr:FAD-dependent monooxygenase [Methylobacterium durans]MEA1832175.1 FAD-dependent monooxygenase [Methylobacterium durans]
MADVLVVGAGPVGLTMAAELARFGVGVRLIDRAAHATETSKALVVWSRTLELMDRMGCTGAFLAGGLRARSASIRSGGTVLGSPRFDNIDSPYNFALMIPQRDTEQLLAAQLHAMGMRVEREVELVSFAEAGGHVVARLRHPDGREEPVQTPWLIGCDGAHSTVRHGLGIAFRGSAQGDDWLLADVRLEGPGTPPPDEIATYLHRDGPFVVFPIPGGRARVVATRGPTEPAHPRPDPTLADVQALVDQRAGGFRVTDPVWLTNFRINERKVDAYRHGRVFLAGDAAHIHSPAGGQGMNTGMQDAINLAWKLALVVRGEAGEALLDSYSPERSAVGDMVLRNAERLTDMATLSHPAAQAARNLALRFLLGLHAVRDRMATQMSEIEIAYAGSPLSIGPRAGARWEPENNVGPPPGAGGAPRFLLYAADAERGSALAARFPALLDPTPRTPPDASALFVVRPDGYVGLSARRNAWDEADRYLQSIAKADG